MNSVHCPSLLKGEKHTIVTKEEGEEKQRLHCLNKKWPFSKVRKCVPQLLPCLH